jgi:SGNH hydrolase-like domain, acetyltransferase AlgX
MKLVHATMQFADPKRAAVFWPFEKYILDSLLEMANLLAQKGIGFMVVAYPDAIQVDSQLRSSFLTHFGERETDYEWNRAQNILRRFCTEHGIEFHDLLPIFVDAESKGGRLYRLNDNHWSATGNEMAARFYYDLLIGRIH